MCFLYWWTKAWPCPLSSFGNNYVYTYLFFFFLYFVVHLSCFFSSVHNDRKPNAVLHLPPGWCELLLRRPCAGRKCPRVLCFCHAEAGSGHNYNSTLAFSLSQYIRARAIVRLSCGGSVFILSKSKNRLFIRVSWTIFLKIGPLFVKS